MTIMWQEYQVEGVMSLTEDTNSSTSSLSGGSRNEITTREIADPKVVIKVANRLFERMNDPSGSTLLQASDDTGTLNNGPIIPGSGAIIMEMSESGSLVIPDRPEPEAKSYTSPQELTEYQQLDRCQRALEYTLYDKELCKVRSAIVMKQLLRC